MVNAAKVIALAALDVFGDSELLRRVRADFDKQRAGHEYKSLLPPDAKPDLDYRNQ